MLVYGKNVLKEIAPKKIRKVYISKNKTDHEILDYLVQNHIKYEMVSLERINQMTSGNHQGIVILRDDFSYEPLETCFDEDFVVLLDHLEDPHNLGAIIRSAEAAGVKSIIIPKDRSVRVNETVMKTSAGAIENIKVIIVSNIRQTIEILKKQNFFIYGADMVGENYKSFDFSGKKVLVIGNEGKGISEIVKKSCDVMVSIPMNGQINSLNASVAAGILIFQMMGERNGL